MIWKGKEQFYREGSSLMVLGLFILLMEFLFTWNSYYSVGERELFIVVTGAVLGSLLVVAGLVLMVISRLIVREN